MEIEKNRFGVAGIYKTYTINSEGLDFSEKKQ
jgi:hypothetical protein